MIMNKIQDFANSENGAVTVDFVVLTAMVVGLGMSVAALFAPSLGPAMSGVEPAMETAQVLGANSIGG